MVRRVRIGLLRTIALGVALGALPTGCRHFEPAPLAPDEQATRLESRSLADPALRTFIEEAVGHPLASWPQARWDLDGLTLAAFHFHPELAIARADWQVARAGIETAGARPNPTIGIAPEFVSNAESAVSPWIGALHLDWPIETAGKRRHRVTRADELARAVRFGLDSTAWRVRGELRAGLVELRAAEERTAHLERESELQRELLRLLEAQLASGAISRAELLPQRLAALQADFDLAESRGRRDAARVRVASAIGLPLRGVEGVELAAPPPEPGEGHALRSDEARRRALLGRSDVQAALASYAASQAALQLEIAKQYPDLHIGTGYQFDQGANKWGLGVVLELPLLNRNEGPIAEAEAQRTRAAARFEALQARVISEVEQASAAHESARGQLVEARSLADERAERRDLAARALAAGAASRATLRAADLELERAERLRDEAQARVLDAEARLEQAVQPPLDFLALAAGGSAP